MRVIVNAIGFFISSFEPNFYQFIIIIIFVVVVVVIIIHLFCVSKHNLFPSPLGRTLSGAFEAEHFASVHTRSTSQQK